MNLLYLLSKNSSNNLNILLNSFQSIMNDTENNNNILNDICDILEKKIFTIILKLNNILIKLLYLNHII